MTWGLMELYFWKPKLIYVAVILGYLLMFFTIRQFLLESRKKESWLNYSILPIVFFTGLTVFSTMVSSSLLVQLLIIINTIFLYFYFRTIYYYLVKTKLYQPNSLQNISSYGNFLAFYFIASSVYGLQVFMGISIWILMIFTLGAIAIITYQVLWVNKVDLEPGAVYILIICLALTEIAWAASFLTLSFYILGLILAVSYYILIGLVRFYLLGRLSKSLVKIYLIFGLSSIIIVLLTAKWISFS